MNTKKTIILECDSFNLKKLKEWIDDIQLDKKAKTFILTKSKNHHLFKTELIHYSNIDCIDYNFIFNYESINYVSAKELFNFKKFYHKDDIYARLLDRDGYIPKYGLGNQHGFTYYIEKSLNTLNFLKDNKIDFVYFRNTPHHSIEWLLAKAADFLSISIFTSEKFIFPWLFSISKGYLMSRELEFKNEVFESENEINFHIKTFIEKTSRDYDTAIPQYEKNRRGKGFLEYYNPIKHIKEAFIRPHKFYSRTANFFYYKKLAKHLNLTDTKYVIFFLHYQPERTTLPEGYDFIDQVFAIRVLRLLLPKEIQLLVKEHPSTFMNNSEPKVRNKFFYNTINNMSGVSLVPITIDSFNLIDNSFAVATITGTVSVESYIRKKPTILFGRSQLKVKGVHVFTDIDNLSNFINDIFNNKFLIKPYNKQLLELCSKGVISGLKNKKEEAKDYHDLLNHEEHAHLKLLSKLIEEKI